MKLRTGKITSEPWPFIRDTTGKQLHINDFVSLSQLMSLQADDTYTLQTVVIQLCYLVLNNKHFVKEDFFQDVLSDLIELFQTAIDPPPRITSLFNQVCSLIN